MKISGKSIIDLKIPDHSASKRDRMCIQTAVCEQSVLNTISNHLKMNPGTRKSNHNRRFRLVLRPMVL